MFVVFTEIINDNGIERWYYGTYEKARANEVAYQLGGEYPIYHSICPLEDAKKWGIKNLPM